MTNREQKFDSEILDAIYRYTHAAPLFSAEYEARRSEAVTILMHRAMGAAGAGSMYLEFGEAQQVRQALDAAIAAIGEMA